MAKKSKKQPTLTSTFAAQASSQGTSHATFSASTSPMDPALLERLIALMASAELSELDVSDGAKRVSLKRGGGFVAQAPVGYAPVSYATAPALAQPSTSASKSPAPAVADDSALLKIKSPMVGTFYSKSSPDARPFVSIGTVVNEDSDVCIIEAMKVFNNIKAECNGTIEKVLIENGEVVEFGQVLFLVKAG